MRSITLAALLCAGCAGDDEEGLPGERFEFQGAIHTVVVTAASGSVALTAKDGAIAAVFTPTEEGDNFQFEDSQGRLVLGSTCQDGTIGCGTSIDVELPRGTDFEVTTTSGPVTIAGMDVVGSVETEGGPVIGTQLGPMILDIRTLTADQTISFRDEPISVTMDGGSGGDLDLTVPAGGYNLDTSAGGSITTQGIDQSSSGPDLTLNTGGDIVVTGA